jgi:DNA-directed RNA polymerase specialized sigma24 family protein
MLRYYHELGIAEIAETLGLSPNSVKTHLQRGLAALERRLGDGGQPS